MFNGDKVKLASGVRNYEAISQQTICEVLDDCPEGKPHLVKLRVIAHPRSSWYINQVGTYKKENFVVTEPSSLPTNYSDIRAIFSGTKFYQVADKEKVDEIVEKLIKSNPNSKFTVFKPEYEAFLPSLPIERRHFEVTSSAVDINKDGFTIVS